MARFPVALVAPLLFLAPQLSNAQTVVTTCGQETSGRAVLNADLDCTGFNGYALTMHGGKLTLNGHTITGSTTPVFCDADCKIVGPGTITGSTAFGVNGYGATVRMRQVDLSNNAYDGLQCFKSCFVEGPATISGNGAGIRSGGNSKVKNVTITGNLGYGVKAANVPETARVIVQGSTISGNGTAGVVADVLARVSDTSVSGNGRFGIQVSDLPCDRNTIAVVKRSAITGNGTNSGCGTTEACGDVATCGVAPHLRVGASCDHSYVNGSGVPGDAWNVCGAD